jgi:hypothetical protein
MYNHFEASDWSNIVGADQYAGGEIFSMVACLFKFLSRCWQLLRFFFVAVS